MHAWSYVGESISERELGWFEPVISGDVATPPGLYSGKAGIAWALHGAGATDEAATLLHRSTVEMREYSDCSLANGLAGVLLTTIHFWASTHDIEFRDRAVALGRQLADRAERLGTGIVWREPTDRIALGYPYGSSGIGLAFLALSRCDHTNAEEWLDLALGASDHDVAHLVTTSKGLAMPAEPGGNVVYPYWSRGSGGVLKLLTRLYSETHSETLLGLIERMVDQAIPTYAVTPGLFNGLAGVLDTALDVQMFTPIDMAGHIDHLVKTLLRFGVKRPDGVSYLDDRLMRLTIDFGGGSAGIMCVLERARTRGPAFNFSVDDILGP